MVCSGCPGRRARINAIQLRTGRRDLFPDPVKIDLEENAALTCSLIQVYVSVEKAYGEYKLLHEVRDFDDLIQHTCAALRDDEALRHRVAQGIKYLFMDEFQDTDGLQLEIARLLHDAPGGPSLFLVGDVKQSIYGFRGAEVEVFQEEIKNAEAVHRLDMNFRTLPDVMAFINHFFSSTGLLDGVEAYGGDEGPSSSAGRGPGSAVGYSGS